MKILFYQWHSFMNEGVEKGLSENNIEYDSFFYQLKDWEKDEIFVDKFSAILNKQGYDSVFSINYVPLISDICMEKGIPYVAWVYDSPIHIRDLSSLKNDCNKIYFFDRGQAEEYLQNGIRAYHMPLAVDTELWAKKIRENYNFVDHAQISFVGQLYHTQYNYFMSPLDEYLQGFCEGIINSQGKIYGGYLLGDLVTDELLDKMNQDYARASVDGFQMGKRELEFLLASETTHRERYTILTLLANHFDVSWYTGDKDAQIANAQIHPYADYTTRMPVIFHKSDINLNISLKTIRTGIPLRALDIMGCGGFLLSNYQVELDENFRIDQECVLYDSIEDMYQKVEFYIANDSLRNCIAAAGFEKVKRDFTFKDRIEKMLLK